MNSTIHKEPIPVQDRVREKTERLEAIFSRINTRIHTFPEGLRGIGGPDGRYITPSVVALGPYHHGLPHLQEMEELKHAAAHYFCKESGQQVEEVYSRILSIAEEARGCYDEDALARLGQSQSQFAEMMFLDGCFLLTFITVGYADFQYPSLLTNGIVLSMGPCMLRDIMLLENQLPWLLLEALMPFKNVGVLHIYILEMLHNCLLVKGSPRTRTIQVNEDYNPPHLLGLARFYLTATMPEMIPISGVGEINMATLSAIKLSEMGVKLKASKESWFPDMRVNGCELSLSPMFLSDSTACWLVNMAAFEARTMIDYPSDRVYISSYLCLLALLMDKEEDVHELRGRSIVSSDLSNQDTLEFFKAITRHLRHGHRFYAIFEAIQKYKRQRRVWIFIHRLIYHNWKYALKLISIASVLVGIFKALYSLKQN